MRGYQYTKICTFLLLLLPVACQSTKDNRVVTPPLEPSHVVKRGLPGWFNLPKNWTRLDEIEAWLKSPAALDSEWRNYGRIELAEGWLEISSENAETAAYRRTRAHKLLNLVREDPAANSGLKLRAMRLMNEAALTVGGGFPAGVELRKRWKAAPAKRERLSPVGGPWEKITVHHSDAVGSLIFNGSASESRAVVKAIQRHHQTENGWGDIGYHFLIDARGRVFEGRSMTWQGAHAGDAKKNRRNIGVCLLGNFEQSHPTQAARDALSNLLDGLRNNHHISRKEVYLHSEMTTTKCPGRHLSKWVNYYRATS